MEIMFACFEVSYPVSKGITEHDNNYGVSFLSPFLDLHCYVHLPYLDTPIIANLYDVLSYNVMALTCKSCQIGHIGDVLGPTQLLSKCHEYTHHQCAGVDMLALGSLHRCAIAGKPTEDGPSC